MDEQEAWLRLIRVQGLDGPRLAPLLERFPSASDLLCAGTTGWSAAGVPPGLTREFERTLSLPVDVERRWLDQPDHHLVTWGSTHYPTLLAEISDAPVALYAAGRLDALTQPQFAIVGTRNPTPAGRETAQAFAAELCSCGLAITSGLAVGIDAAAHRGALQAAGVTVAVCATGLDRMYPAAHAELAAEITQHGALVSEFPPGTAPLRHHFPHRNRIISGLAVGTLVVEAALQSGSLITARLAAEQGREVFAVPGSVHSPLTRGCHRLIRDGAHLTESVADILAELGPLAAALATLNAQIFDCQRVSTGKLDKDYEILLDALGFSPTGVDALVARSGLKVGEVASMLLILELEGRVESYPGGLYIRT